MPIMPRLLPLLLCLPPLLAGAADDLIRLTPERARKAGIASAALSESKATTELRLPAQVVVPPAQVEVIAAPVAGMVAAVRVAYGETIKKGQVLARLQGSQLLELQRDFADARLQAELAAENRQRDEALFADGIIAGARVAATRAAERQAALRLAERRQSLQLAGAAAPDAKAAGLTGTADIRAPFDAVVLEATAQPGQRVDPQAPLFKLGRIAPLWLEIQAAPTQAAGIAPGDAVSVAGCAQPGRVTLVAPAMQAASQSLLIRAELASPRGCVMPFQYVQASIVAVQGRVAGNWRLPPGALTRHQGRSWVFMVVPEGFKPIAVKVVAEAPDAVVVAGDLPEDAQVAIRGTTTLKAVWLGLGAGEADGK
jgi:RND family efflux transporter MFP subunit